MKKQLVLDTNVFIRLVVRDVPSQYQTVVSLFERIEKGQIIGKVSILVINEIVWILEKFYNIKRTVYLPILLKLLLLKDIKIIEIKKTLLLEILSEMITKRYDFTDIYLSHIASRKNIFSFDKDFEKIDKEK